MIRAQTAALTFQEAGIDIVVLKRGLPCDSTVYKRDLQEKFVFLHKISDYFELPSASRRVICDSLVIMVGHPPSEPQKSTRQKFSGCPGGILEEHTKLALAIDGRVCRKSSSSLRAPGHIEIGDNHRPIMGEIHSWLRRVGTLGLYVRRVH